MTRLGYAASSRQAAAFPNLPAGQSGSASGATWAGAWLASAKPGTFTSGSPTRWQMEDSLSRTMSTLERKKCGRPCLTAASGAVVSPMGTSPPASTAMTREVFSSSAFIYDLFCVFFYLPYKPPLITFLKFTEWNTMFKQQIPHAKFKNWTPCTGVHERLLFGRPQLHL